VVRYRPMATGEETAVLGLVMRGFAGYVRPDCTEAGAAEFTRTVRSFVLDRPAGHVITVAESDGRLVGMIDVRDACHISLFFVERDSQGRGIGRALLETALSRARTTDPDLRAITVNSSPWAVPIYTSLEFVRVGPEQEREGIRFVPMERRLPGEDSNLD
jgi:GNAT superfamily N-acetyltransferase